MTETGEEWGTEVIKVSKTVGLSFDEFQFIVNPLHDSSSGFSDYLESQVDCGTCGGWSCQDWLCLSTALIITSNFRIQATSANVFGLP